METLRSLSTSFSIRGSRVSSGRLSVLFSVRPASVGYGGHRERREERYPDRRVSWLDVIQPRGKCTHAGFTRTPRTLECSVRYRYRSLPYGRGDESSGPPPFDRISGHVVSSRSSMFTRAINTGVSCSEASSLT